MIARRVYGLLLDDHDVPLADAVVKLNIKPLFNQTNPAAQIQRQVTVKTGPSGELDTTLYTYPTGETLWEGKVDDYTFQVRIEAGFKPVPLRGSFTDRRGRIVPLVPGPRGGPGWSPVIANVEDGLRVVQQIVDWIGGVGLKPSTGQYIGPEGFVSNIEDGTNIRPPE